MRVTHNQTGVASIGALQDSLRRVVDRQKEVATGFRINDMVGDPSSASDILDANNQLRAYEQYKRSTDSAMSRARAAEGVYDSLTKLLDRAKELGMSQMTSGASAQSRATVKAELDQILTTAVTLANTKFDGAYLFGGDQALAAPFTMVTGGPTLSFTTSTPAGQNAVEVLPNQTLVPVHNGVEAFGDLTNGPLAALRDLAAAMTTGGGSLTPIGDALAELDTAIDSHQTRLGDLGARTNAIETAQASITVLAESIKERRSALRDVDLPEALTDLARSQATFQAAMLATQRVLDMALTNYLR